MSTPGDEAVGGRLALARRVITIILLLIKICSLYYSLDPNVHDGEIADAQRIASRISTLAPYCASVTNRSHSHAVTLHGPAISPAGFDPVIFLFTKPH